MKPLGAHDGGGAMDPLPPSAAGGEEDASSSSSSSGSRRGLGASVAMLHDRGAPPAGDISAEYNSADFTRGVYVASYRKGEVDDPAGRCDAILASGCAQRGWC